jgi:hypothetical protein
VSIEEVRALLRAARDENAFAAQLAEAPSILTGYDLTVEERRALLRRDLERLRELGIDDESLLAAVAVIGRPERQDHAGPG